VAVREKVNKARRIMGEHVVRVFIAEGVCPVVDHLADLGFVIGLGFSAHEFDPVVSFLFISTTNDRHIQGHCHLFVMMLSFDEQISGLITITSSGRQTGHRSGGRLWFPVRI
jgi:hypothetical protein